MIEDSHQIRGDFPSQNRESDSKSLFHRVCKTLDKVKVHIVYRARLNIIYTFADATRVYVRVEGSSDQGWYIPFPGCNSCVCASKRNLTFLSTYDILSVQCVYLCELIVPLGRCDSCCGIL